MKAFNMASGQEIYFDEKTAPDYAVAYAYHVETNSTASRFFASVRDNDGWWQASTPFIHGRFSVAAGDWAALKNQGEQ